jgi:hypothetical protein
MVSLLDAGYRQAEAVAGEPVWIDPEGYKAAVEERQSAFEKVLKGQKPEDASRSE